MKGTRLTTYLSVTRPETRRRLVDDELRAAEGRGLAHRLASRPRRRRLLTAVRGAAAA